MWTSARPRLPRRRRWRSKGRPVTDGVRGIICGAHNFAVGDLVVVGLPGTVLAGGFTLTSRKTYGHISDGMICAEDELGIGSDHTGIIVLPMESGLTPGDDPSAYLGLGDEVLGHQRVARHGLLHVDPRTGREAAQALGVAFTDVVDRAVPAPVAGGYPVVLEDEACSLFVALTVTGVDETAASRAGCSSGSPWPACGRSRCRWTSPTT